MKKVIVFDMDETIGAFSALSRNMNELTYVLSYELFCNMMRENDAYLRPGILNVLAMVVEATKVAPGLLFVLYTNNANVEWIGFVVHYLKGQLGVPRLFDHVVHGADPRRQPLLEKSVEDLCMCTGIKGLKKCPFFFVDDQYHEKMNVAAVTYFLISPYREPKRNEVTPTVSLQRALIQFFNQ